MSTGKMQPEMRTEVVQTLPSSSTLIPPQQGDMAANNDSSISLKRSIEAVLASPEHFSSKKMVPSNDVVNNNLNRLNNNNTIVFDGALSTSQKSRLLLDFNHPHLADAALAHKDRLLSNQKQHHMAHPLPRESTNYNYHLFDDQRTNNIAMQQPLRHQNQAPMLQAALASELYNQRVQQQQQQQQDEAYRARSQSSILAAVADQQRYLAHHRAGGGPGE
eukprot:scaffold367661_cov63-Attheya_sp.AAC.1